jgi:hypothetical protein
MAFADVFLCFFADLLCLKRLDEVSLVFHVLEEVDCGKFRDEKHEHQGCQMVYFQTETPNLVTFWRLLQWKILVYFMAI